MEPKRELTGVDLVALVGELRGYTGAVCDKAYLYPDDLVRLKLRDHDRGRVELLCEVGDVKRVNVARPDHVADAPTRPPDFARKLRSRIAGATMAEVRQHGFDRVLEFEFRRSDADTTVIVELFGEGNVVVLNDHGEVVATLETVRLKSRTVAPGAPYEFPAPRAHPAELEFQTFEAEIRDSDTDLVRTLATQLDFGGLWAEELCTRAGVEKTRAVSDADSAELQALYDTIQRVFDSLAAGLDPRIYLEDADPVDVTPVPMDEHADLESEAFETFNSALDQYFVDLERSGETPTDEEPLDEEIARQERIIAQQESAIEEFADEAAAERERAEALYAHYDLVDEVIETVRSALASGHSWAEIQDRLDDGRDRGIEAAEAVTQVNPDSGTLTLALDDLEVPVDPRIGVEQNADRLYTSAKEIDSKREGAASALEDTREELERLKARRAREPDPDDEDAESATPTDWLERDHIPIRSTERWFETFRWFRTANGFLVIGGRDADQNERIVDKYAERYDRFFHTQAHGGPATVLKTSDPSEPSKEIEVPQTDLEQAAQFAVSYSTVWKEGRYSGDVYMVRPDQVSKTPESGEYLAKGGFAIRGDRTYFRETSVGCAVGIACEPETRVIGGPPDAIEPAAETAVAVEPGQYRQADVGKRIYRVFRDRFRDTAFVRKVASPDRIQHFLPPGGSRMVDE